MTAIPQSTRAVSRAAVLGLVAALAVSGCSILDDPERDEESGELTESGDVDVFDIAVGDCLSSAIPQDEEVASIEATPCSEPHTEEIFAAVTVPDGDWPGQDAVDAESEQCLDEFADFVGMVYEESVLEVNILAPTEESWAQGDREILCSIFDPAGDTTGTLLDANR